MKGYKGFDKDFKCRGKQYAENTTFEEDSAEICKSGMHFCENPFDVFQYYPPADDNGNLNTFAEVESIDDLHTVDTQKYCTKKLHIGAKLSLGEFVKVGVDFILSKVKNTETNTGYRSASTNTGDRSASRVEGKESVAMAIGYQSKAAGALGCWIVLAEWDDNAEHIINVKSHKVDGRIIKPDVFYKLKNGKFVICREDE